DLQVNASPAAQPPRPCPESWGAVRTLDRSACRRDAETRFSDDRMVDDYEALFRRVLNGPVGLPTEGSA
ncbi:MAG TPA: hypothetical protein VFE45_16975, partial [Coriobacteriia bacterium]|nr:hypothetical protein [Coriobacteriia bacterium]